MRTLQKFNSHAISAQQFANFISALYNLMDGRWWRYEAIEMHAYKLSIGSEKLKLDKIMSMLWNNWFMDGWLAITLCDSYASLVFSSLLGAAVTPRTHARTRANHERIVELMNNEPVKYRWHIYGRTEEQK